METIEELVARLMQEQPDSPEVQQQVLEAIGRVADAFPESAIHIAGENLRHAPDAFRETLTDFMINIALKDRRIWPDVVLQHLTDKPDAWRKASERLQCYEHLMTPAFAL